MARPRKTENAQNKSINYRITEAERDAMAALSQNGSPANWAKAVALDALREQYLSAKRSLRLISTTIGEVEDAWSSTSGDWGMLGAVGETSAEAIRLVEQEVDEWAMERYDDNGSTYVCLDTVLSWEDVREIRGTWHDHMGREIATRDQIDALKKVFEI